MNTDNRIQGLYSFLLQNQKLKMQHSDEIQKVFNTCTTQVKPSFHPLTLKNQDYTYFKKSLYTIGGDETTTFLIEIISKFEQTYHIGSVYGDNLTNADQISSAFISSCKPRRPVD